MSSRRLWTLGVAWAALAVAAPPATAQTDACTRAFAQAEARYLQGAFEAVEPALTPCLDAAEPSVPAYRLLALARLRQGEIASAKRALLRILAVRPDYEPDPVQDPPDFVALIRVVKEQVALEAPPPAPAEPVVAPAEPVAERRPVLPAPARPAVLPEEEGARAADDPAPPPTFTPPPVEPAEPPALPLFGYRYWLGLGSYGGERGASGSGPVGEFIDNAGPGIGIGVTLALGPRLRAFGDLDATRYSTLTTPKEGGRTDIPGYEDSTGLSPWVRTAVVGAHVLLRTEGLTPYVLAGGGIAMGGRDGAQVAGLVTLGAGVEAPLFAAGTVFFEGSGSVVAPGRALDAAGDRADLFSGFRLGLRYQAGE